MSWRNELKVSWTRLFFIFCQLSAIIIWWFFKVPQSLWRTPLWKKSSNMAKNEEKPCSTCLQPISPNYCRYPKSGFRVPVPPLATKTREVLLYYTHIFGLKKTHTITFMLKEQDKTFVASNQAQFFFILKQKNRRRDILKRTVGKAWIIAAG